MIKVKILRDQCGNDDDKKSMYGLVWDSKDVLVLRENKIVGAFVGALGKCPNQNNYLGLPLLLSEAELNKCIQLGIVDKGLILSLEESFDSLSLSNKEDLTLIRLTDLAKRQRDDYFVHPELSPVPKTDREEEIYTTTASRFGAEVAVYPGDPVRYHSLALIHSVDYNDRKHRIIDLVKWGRVAHSARKIAWIISNKEDKLQCLSVSWAGKFDN